jgi:hypothetical protein
MSDDYTNTYVEFRCPNKPYPDGHDKDHYVCNSFLGAISAEILISHDWSKPYVDIRRCSNGGCGVVWKITITDILGVPVFERLPSEIPCIPFGDIFALHEVHGRKTKK